MQILTFGNNLSGSLAEDINAEQTTIQLLQGEGARFSEILSTEYQNPTIPLSYYAKLTLTDNQQSSHEIVHLTGVVNDTLTVVRGREKTQAQGWQLGDFIGCMPTRGTENEMIQIGHLQSAFYNSGTAGGTANALTLQLPTGFFANSATEWELNTPLVIIPSQENTGAATLQITLGDKTIGTYPLYKGEKDELDPGDILKGVPLLCLLNKAEGYVSLVNPSAIYDVLGTAAFADSQTSRGDRTPGHLAQSRWVLGLCGGVARSPSGGTVTDCNDLPANAVSFVYDTAKNGPGMTASLLDFAGLADGYRVQLAVSYYETYPRFKIRAFNNDAPKRWTAWETIFSQHRPPSAADVGAVPLTRTINDYALDKDINLTSQDIFTESQILNQVSLDTIVTPGLYFQNYDNRATAANKYPQANAGALVVINSGVTASGQPNNSVRQFYYPYNDQRSYTRNFNATAWGPWTRIYDTRNPPNAVDIGAVPATRQINGKTLNKNIDILPYDIFNRAVSLEKANLNDIKSPGLYYQYANANTSIAQNYPEAAAGALIVYQAAGIVQVYERYGGDGTWKRTFYDNKWSAWTRYYTTGYKPSAADVGAIPLGGSEKITGNMRTSQEWQSTSANSYRIAYNNRGMFWRFDGSNLYLMFAAQGAPYGSYNNLRPFYVDYVTGKVTMGVDVAVGGNLSCNKTVSAGGALSAKGNVTGAQLIPSNYGNFDARYATKSQSQNTLVKGTSGYHIDASTGMMVQWGTCKRGGTNFTKINFPRAFPQACVNVQFTLLYTNGLHDANIYVDGVSASGCTYVGQNGEKDIYWVAYGY